MRDLCRCLVKLEYYNEWYIVNELSLGRCVFIVNVKVENKGEWIGNVDNFNKMLIFLLVIFIIFGFIWFDINEWCCNSISNLFD